MSKLIKGSDLSPYVKKQVLNAYIYRHTHENLKRSKQYNPTVRIPPVSDTEWLEAHAFYVLNDGSRLARNRNYCEPAWMIEHV